LVVIPYQKQTLNAIHSVSLSISNPLPHQNGDLNLRQVLGSVALVRLNNLSASQLLVGVGRVKDLLVANNGESLETLASAELTAPGAADGEGTALDVLVGLGAGWVAGDLVGAGGGGGAVVGVDGEAVVAGAVGAGTLEVLHGPGGAGCHHGDIGSGSWGGESATSGGQDGEEGGGELHFDVWWSIGLRGLEELM